MESSIFMLILAFILIFLNGFFVISEFAIVKIRKTKLEELVKEDVSNAKLALDITNSLDTYLSATQLGITLSSLALGWIGEPAVSRLIESPLKNYFDLNDILVHAISFTIAFTLITLLHVVLGELVPKSIAIAKPEQSTLFISRPLHLFWIIFSPFIKVFDFLARSVLKLMKIRPANEHEIAHSEEEIRIIVSQSQKGGVLDLVETEIIKNAIDFSDTTAFEIMTPRKDMICLNKQNGYDENFQTMIDSKYTRFPYIDGSKDNVLGMIHIRDVIRSKEKNFDKMVRKILMVPENSSISKILLTMNKEHISAALIMDEYGGTSGLITIEDIIEEIFGDINDEHDEKYTTFSKISDDVYEFHGRVDLQSVEEMLDIKFDEQSEAVTIGGYVFYLLGRLPVVKDKISDDICTYEVVKMNNTSIDIVRVSKNI